MKNNIRKFIGTCLVVLLLTGVIGGAVMSICGDPPVIGSNIETTVVRPA